MFYSDYHIHTNYSQDSDASMEDMIKKAIHLGLSEIAITDHVDYDEYTPPINFDEYIRKFEAYKEKYRKDIHLTLGVEIGLGPDVSAEVTKLSSSYDFDFIIGSSHAVSGMDLYFGDYFKGKDKYDAYSNYFLDIINNINNVEEFCVYGHLDFISRYGKYADNSLRYEDFKDVIDEVLIKLIGKGKGIEINTSGFRYNINQTYPQIEILKRFKELGGEIVTIGSDAHSPKYIAERFDAAFAMLEEAGFRYIALYRGRKPYFHKI